MIMKILGAFQSFWEIKELFWIFGKFLLRWSFRWGESKKSKNILKLLIFCKASFLKKFPRAFLRAFWSFPIGFLKALKKLFSTASNSTFSIEQFNNNFHTNHQTRNKNIISCQGCQSNYKYYPARVAIKEVKIKTSKNLSYFNLKKEFSNKKYLFFISSIVLSSLNIIILHCFFLKTSRFAAVLQNTDLS